MNKDLSIIPNKPNNMRSKLHFALLFIILTLNSIKAQTTFRDSFMGNYNCTLIENPPVGSPSSYNDTLYLTPSTNGVMKFLASDSQGTLFGMEFTLLPDSSFSDTTASSNRYGNFYQGDSLYIITISPSGMGPFIARYYCRANTISLKEITSYKSILLYPNPASEKCTILFKEEVFVRSFRILSIDGKSLESKEINIKQIQFEINTSPLEDGIYFLRAETNEGIVIKKITIQK